MKGENNMKKIHECKITTLKNQDWFKKTNIKGTVMMCQYLSNIQVSDGDKYFEVSNPGVRGVIAESGPKADIFDIAYNPQVKPISKAVKYGYMNLIKEKIQNDLEVYRKLVEKMGLKDSEAKITMEDISKHITDKDEFQKALDAAISKRAAAAVANAIVKKE